MSEQTTSTSSSIPVYYMVPLDEEDFKSLVRLAEDNASQPDEYLSWLVRRAAEQELKHGG